MLQAAVRAPEPAAVRACSRAIPTEPVKCSSAAEMRKPRSARGVGWHREAARVCWRAAGRWTQQRARLRRSVRTGESHGCSSSSASSMSGTRNVCALWHRVGGHRTCLWVVFLSHVATRTHPPTPTYPQTRPPTSVYTTQLYTAFTVHARGMCKRAHSMNTVVHGFVRRSRW